LSRLSPTRSVAQPPNIGEHHALNAASSTPIALRIAARGCDADATETVTPLVGRSGVFGNDRSKEFDREVLKLIPPSHALPPSVAARGFIANDTADRASRHCIDSRAPMAGRSCMPHDLTGAEPRTAATGSGTMAYQEGERAKMNENPSGRDPIESAAKRAGSVGPDPCGADAPSVGVGYARTREQSLRGAQSPGTIRQIANRISRFSSPEGTLITQRQIDQVFSDLRSTCGGLPEDYFGLLYLEMEHDVPRAKGRGSGRLQRRFRFFGHGYKWNSAQGMTGGKSMRKPRRNHSAAFKARWPWRRFEVRRRWPRLRPTRRCTRPK